jgi:hypothetical protein
MRPTSTAAGVWPLPTLEPPPLPSGASRRSAQRQARASITTNVANDAIRSCNVLARSFYRVTPFHLHYQSPIYSQRSSTLIPKYKARNSTATQHQLIARIYQSASRFVSRRGAFASECDDPLFNSKFLDEHFTNANISAYISQPKAPIVPILSTRIALPASPGTVDLLSLLPPDVAKEYAEPNPELFRLPSDQPNKPMPRARRVGSIAEWTATVARLRAADMVDFTTTPMEVCGVHAVRKDDKSDRFIIDARRTNRQFKKPRAVQLPTPDLLARLVADPSRPLYVAKVDLDNFYHRLRLPAWLWPYFALPQVRAGDVGLGDRFGENTMVHPCCKTLPMGWSHSVLLAQLAHEHFLNTATDLKPEDRITVDNDPLLNRTRHQVYIDDLNIFDTDPERARRVQDAYITAITRLGLVVKASKVVRPTADGSECIGLEVDGRRHTIGVSAAKLETLCADTIATLERGRCSGYELATLVGRWTWAMLANRPSLACLNAVYRYADCAEGRVFTIWNSVRTELLTAVGLTPLLFSSLGADWFPKVVATDACETGLGVVSSRTVTPPVSLGREAAEQAAAVAATDHRWSTIVSARWRDEEHINVLELRALTVGVKWVCSHPSSTQRRVWMLADSSVIVGAVSKGRSSSPSLLRRLRHLSAWVLAAGLQLRVTYVPSEFNPADEPSRR